MTAAPIPALLILSFASLRLMQTFCTDTVLGCALLRGVRRDILMERDPPRPPHADRRENPLRKLSRSGRLSCPREMLALPRHPLLCSHGSRLLGRSRGLSGGTAHGGPTPGLAPSPGHICARPRGRSGQRSPPFTCPVQTRAPCTQSSAFGVGCVVSSAEVRPPT